ncbi:MAG: phosphoribulokinase [Panacagrimonas sp.]
MSARHPVIGVTGSSGAGTSAAMAVFRRMFAKLGLKAAIVEGDAFHAYDREGNRKAIERARIRGENFSLFGPAGNHLDRLQALLRDYGQKGTGISRHYLHTDTEAAEAGQPPGTFTPWERLPADTDLLFYEGLHGGYVGEDADIASHMDLLIGVVPVINLEWIQKIRRDTDLRGHRPEDVTKTILRRMPDYVTHIVPQFSRTDVNFQRVPLVDTSNPFVIRDIPAAEESLVVIHFNEQTRLRADAGALARAVRGSRKSNKHTVVVPGKAMERSMELIFKPALEALASTRLRLAQTAPAAD